jgi:predicted nucleotidyltransferase
MFTKKQLELFKVFADNPFIKLTFKEIKELTNSKSNNQITLFLKNLKKEELIQEKQIANTKQYCLNLDNKKNLKYIFLAKTENFTENLTKDINIILNHLSKNNPFASIILFGSYVKETEKKNSDLDIAIIIENKSKEIKAKIAIKEAALKTELKIDSQIITEKEFKEMLKNNEENLGKQIAKNHLAIQNQEAFYNIIINELENGINLQDLSQKSKERIIASRSNKKNKQRKKTKR